MNLNIFLNIVDKILSIVNNFLNIKKDKRIYVERFIEIFKNHEVSKNQIPEIYPKIDLSTLNNTEKLNDFIDSEKLEDVAEIFKINNSWLKGDSSAIYKSFSCYKFPLRFFEKANEINYKETFRPILIFTSKDKLNFRSGRRQPIVLVLREKIDEISTKEVFRYYICKNEWQWNREESRIQLKAMLRIFYKHYKEERVPIYKVKRKTLKKIRKGQKVPNLNNIKRPKELKVELQDFVLSKSESVKAKEQEEFPYVTKYADEIKKSLSV